MNNPSKENEQRRHERYPVEAKVYFNVSYQVMARLKFQILDKDKHDKTLSEKLSAMTKNVSVEGLCFISTRELKKGDFLNLYVYLPDAKEPITMQGEVRWCQESSGQKDDLKFETGVKLTNVNGKAVLGSTYHDGANQIIWSPVLESFFGSFRRLAERRVAT
ncbi:MAG: PilZ domain-containing protein [Candidatus Omnitrophica bacterium]|nr:PilZ domain-containing protein [Candidatus Omnitrophota bacterium]MDD5352537.1 PilZ domain-containing protein [Candidatus Omnitrophota bacterium]MDD5550135.1 PilZ domain-containing protein [Candidatus Omnitrophota bacterium]